MAKIIKNRKKGDEGSSSRKDEVEKRLWKKAWGLNIKKKIQHFLWKLCHDRVPVGRNLVRRGVTTEDVCKQCGEAVETVQHPFFNVASHS